MLLIKGKPSGLVEHSLYLCASGVYIWVGADGFVVPCCLRYVVRQIFDPGGVVVIEVESCCYIPYCYDLNTPFVAGEWCLFADLVFGVSP